MTHDEANAEGEYLLELFAGSKAEMIALMVRDFAPFDRGHVHAAIEDHRRTSIFLTPPNLLRAIREKSSESDRQKKARLEIERSQERQKMRMQFRDSANRHHEKLAAMFAAMPAEEFEKYRAAAIADFPHLEILKRPRESMGPMGLNLIAEAAKKMKEPVLA